MSGSGGRPGETDRGQPRHRAPGRPHWSEGGTTDIDNTESRCAIHHPQADDGYQTEILPDGRLRVFRPQDRDGLRFGPAIDEPPPDSGGRGP